MELSFEQLNTNFRSKSHSFRNEVTGVKEKITAMEGHVEYAQGKFQTLHNETRRTSYKKQQILPLREHLGSPPAFVGVRVAHRFSFRCCCFVYLRAVSCVTNVGSVSELSIPGCPFGFL